MIVYLAGPMEKYRDRDWNHEAFCRAEKNWANEGHEVLNPANNFEGRKDLPRPAYLRRGFEQVSGAEALAVMPDWRESRGASLEVKVAKEIQIPVYDIESYRNPTEITQTLLQEAEWLVDHARQESYGHPSVSMGRIAEIWSAILGFKVFGFQVPLMMIGLKLARAVASPKKRDNLRDIAGYAKVTDMVVGTTE